MVSAGDFKNGLTIQMDNNIWQIIEFQHVKPGKGAAFVRTKLKNIVSGGVVEKSFRPTEKFDLAHIEKREYQYLYSDGDLYNFMDTETLNRLHYLLRMLVIHLSSLKRTKWLSSVHTTVTYSLLSHLSLLNFRLQNLNQVLRVIQLQVLQSQLSLKQVLRF